MRRIVQIDATPGERKGAAGIGIVERDGSGTIVAWHQRVIAADTCNAAEYGALLYALQQINASELLILSDSQLVVEQMAGRSKVRNRVLHSLWMEVQQHVARRPQVQVVYAPRSLNRIADALAWDALAGWSQVQHYLLKQGGLV